MATQSVPIPLITGKTPNSSNYNHGNDNKDYGDESPDDDCDDDKDDQTTMTYRSFPITDCRHAPERAHLPGLESTMCRKVRQKGTKYHSCLSNIKNLDIYTPYSFVCFSEWSVAIHPVLRLSRGARSRQWWEVLISLMRWVMRLISEGRLCDTQGHWPPHPEEIESQKRRRFLKPCMRCMLAVMPSLKSWKS